MGRLNAISAFGGETCIARDLDFFKILLILSISTLVRGDGILPGAASSSS